MNKRKTDSPRKRMREIVYKVPKIKRVPTRHALFADSSPEVQDLNWIAAARAALQLDETIVFKGETIPNLTTAAIRRLFAQFNLDPADPWAWRELVTWFSYAEQWQAPKRKIGRPKRSDDSALQIDLASFPPTVSHDAAARKLAVKHAKGNSTSGLRRRIAKVRAKAGT